MKKEKILEIDLTDGFERSLNSAPKIYSGNLKKILSAIFEDIEKSLREFTEPVIECNKKLNQEILSANSMIQSLQEEKAQLLEFVYKESGLRVEITNHSEGQTDVKYCQCRSRIEHN